MNQPSAEDFWKVWNKFVYEPLTEDAMTRLHGAILDRYHLIDKTAPIPGAVSADILLDTYTKPDLRDGLFVATILDCFDIYPKGTVARIRNYNDELEAEIDRLKGQQKPEAVGCGKVLFAQNNLPIAWTFNNQSIYQECGRVSVDSGKTFLCPDCQAKVNNPENPDSSKVVLPEVPRLLSERSKNVYMFEVVNELIECYRAVKAHLEGKDE